MVFSNFRARSIKFVMENYLVLSSIFLTGITFSYICIFVYSLNPVCICVFSGIFILMLLGYYFASRHVIENAPTVLYASDPAIIRAAITDENDILQCKREAEVTFDSLFLGSLEGDDIGFIGPLEI